MTGYRVLPGRRRALCCVCGTVRTCSVNYHGRNATPEWRPGPGWDFGRLLGDMRCATCAGVTRHAVLRDHEPEQSRNVAERELGRMIPYEGAS